MAGIRLLGAIHRRFGRVPFLACLYPVVFWHWIRSGTARRASLEYLRREHMFHQRPGPAPGWWHSLRHFRSFGDTILDKTLAASGRYPFDSLRFVGREPLLAMLERGRGALLVTAHVGCLELCQALAQRQPGLRMNVLVHTAHAEQFNRLLRRLQPDGGVELLQVTDVTPATAILLAERVARGEFVTIAGDRVPVVVGDRSTVAVNFLGREAPFPVGAYVLASLLKCPLYVLGCVREGTGHVVVFEPLAERVRLPRGDRSAALESYARLFAQRLEALVRRAPYDWFNFFPFWDQPGSRTPGRDADAGAGPPARGAQ